MKNRKFLHKEKKNYPHNNNNPIKYNSWDYMDAFEKVLLYENNIRKHSWFLKICSEVYKHEIPIWFVKWLQYFGSTTKLCHNVLRKKIENG